MDSKKPIKMLECNAERAVELLKELPRWGMRREMLMQKTDLRKVRVRKVIEIVRVVGEGTDENPARIVQEYYSFDGKLLARRDDVGESSRR